MIYDAAKKLKYNRFWIKYPFLKQSKRRKKNVIIFFDNEHSIAFDKIIKFIFQYILTWPKFEWSSNNYNIHTTDDREEKKNSTETATMTKRHKLFKKKIYI